MMKLLKQKLSFRSSVPSADAARVKTALAYIDEYWKNLERYHPNDEGTIIGLPHPFIVPASDRSSAFAFEEQYYWDSYFTALGMTKPAHQPIVEGMLENLLYLLQRFGMIPNASRMYQLSHSQPPLLTSYIFLVYERYNKDKNWLKDRMALAEREYRNVWMSTQHPFWHQVHHGLSRYYDINMLHDLAEAESGWDMTTRFDRNCLDFLPIDLNCLLYKYELDFARAARILGDKKAAKTWEAAAAQRKQEVDHLMWSRARNFFFDYNYEKHERGSVWSVAGYYAMWSGLASKDQAKKMVSQLSKFEEKGGLATTMRPLIDFNLFGSVRTQWVRPNGWAPLHYVVVEGLRRYGYEADAKRIALKWLETNTQWFDRHGVFLEKYNVVQPQKLPVEGLYPSQKGFAWTNSVFVRLCEDWLSVGGKP